ncbi:hypothetical protein HDU93_003330 [Gonapodya sp. JEL0774]|nr:hypothetical protein HDU93_003330 [Gonapodya sp. JEL0774]
MAGSMWLAFEISACSNESRSNKSLSRASRPTYRDPSPAFDLDDDHDRYGDSIVYDLAGASSHSTLPRLRNLPSIPPLSEPPSPQPKPVNRIKPPPLKLLDISDDEEDQYTVKASEASSSTRVKFPGPPPTAAKTQPRWKPIRIPGNISSSSSEPSSPDEVSDRGPNPGKGIYGDLSGDDAAPAPKKRRAKKTQGEATEDERKKEAARRARVSGLHNRPICRVRRRASPSVPQEREREEKRRSKDDEKERKKAERELKKKRREEEKVKAEREEEKRLERQQRDANRLRSKTDGMAEMIVDVDLTIVNETSFGVALLADLKKLGILAVNAVQLPVPNTVQWKRRASVRYDVEKERFDPVPEYEETENQVVVMLDAFEFAAVAGDPNDLRGHIAVVQRAYPDQQVTYVIVGVREYFKKHQTLRKQEHRNQFLGIDGAAAPTSRKGKKKGVDVSQLPDPEKFEQRMLWMQMVGGCKLVECHNPEMLIEWMHSFTQEIGIKPYAAWKENLFDFDHNSIRCGTGSADTWLKILMGMHRLTEGHARAIVEKFPTVQSLVDAYSLCGNDTSKASKLLAEIQPYRILGLQQIAIGGLDKGALKSLWVDSFGLKQKGTFQSVKENVDEDILELGAGPLAVEVDIMQPLDASKSPKVHVPPLNHIGLWVDNIEKAVEHMTQEGFRFTPGGIRVGAAGYKVTFVHPKGNEATPKSGEGVLIELVQAPPEVISEYDRLLKK